MRKERGKSRKALPKKYEPLYMIHITTHCPPYGSGDHTRLLQWLNYEHAGVPHAPEEVSPAHMESHYALSRHYQGNLHMELKKDGTSIPYKLEYGGEVYVLVPVPKSALP